jgi:DNA-directed RNA polymerase subunit RPC12/RpoP
VVVEAVTMALVIALAVATLIAAYIGLLGISGALRLARCDRCGHLVVTATGAPPGACAYCRHDRLMHPLHAIYHPHNRPEHDRAH